MRISIYHLGRRTRAVLFALERNEPIIILHRGRQIGILCATAKAKSAGQRVSQHPAFGMWKDRADMQDVEKAVRTIRKGRMTAI